MLSQSALVSIVRKAGQKAAERQSTLPTAADQDLPVASVTANRLLANMLAGSHNELLGEWLSLAAHHRQRVADEHLPALLDLGTNRSALVNPIRTVIGRRGEWLATLNPGWNYALGLSEDLRRISRSWPG